MVAAHGSPCLRIADHPTVRARKPFMHRVEMGESIED